MNCELEVANVLGAQQCTGSDQSWLPRVAHRQILTRVPAKYQEFGDIVHEFGEPMPFCRSLYPEGQDDLEVQLTRG